METLKSDSLAVLQNWRLITSPPLSGSENMRVDADLLSGVERGILPPTLRFFRFKDPTVSYGRLQKRTDIVSFVPASWEAVQRPTGGGIVFHENDFCLSLCWPNGAGPIPKRPQDQYHWIHAVILSALAEDGLHMAACRDRAKPEDPFPTRSCFTNPVGYDLLKNKEKKVGGALRCTRRATLYQGSIQLALVPEQEARLHRAFLSHLAAF